MIKYTGNCILLGAVLRANLQSLQRAEIAIGVQPTSNNGFVWDNAPLSWWYRILMRDLGGRCSNLPAPKGVGLILHLSSGIAILPCLSTTRNGGVRWPQAEWVVPGPGVPWPCVLHGAQGRRRLSSAHTSSGLPPLFLHLSGPPLYCETIAACPTLWHRIRVIPFALHARISFLLCPTYCVEQFHFKFNLNLPEILGSRPKEGVFKNLWPETT